MQISVMYTVDQLYSDISDFFIFNEDYDDENLEKLINSTI